jgi:YjbE family integral membrane protein
MSFGDLAGLADVAFWVRWVQIMILNLTLSGDNALVIALAVRNLPRRQEWHGRLWGTVGAVVLRVLFTGVVIVLLRVPLLQAVGGGLLVWIAVKLLIQQEEEAGEGRRGATLFEAIWIIIVADIVMSLDNVLAVAAAARGDMLLVILGVGLSIPIVVWGAGLLAQLMGRLPWIVDLGAGILGWVGGGMILEDTLVRGWLGEPVLDALHWGFPGALGVAVIVAGRLWAVRRARLRRHQRASPK